MDELPSTWLSMLVAEGDPAASYSAANITIKLVSVLLLVAANGFFVAAEFAFVGVRTSRIESLVTAGSRSAKRLMELLQNLNAYLSACQLGITLASLALGWIGEPAIARLLEPLFAGAGARAEQYSHTIATALAFTIISILHIVIGELAPKSVAIQKPVGTSLWA